MDQIAYTIILMPPFSAVGLSAMNVIFQKFSFFFIWSVFLNAVFNPLFFWAHVNWGSKKKKQKPTTTKSVLHTTIFKIYKHPDWFSTALLPLSDIRRTCKKKKK